jgi:uncharacterized protein (TIGR01777 family)
VKIAVAGSSGLIGRALVDRLTHERHDVLTLVRRPPQHHGEVRWDPATGFLPPGVLAGVDAVVNLAGAGVGDHRWTEDYKRLLVSSRIDATRTLVTALLDQDSPATVLVNASAQGFYGDRGEEVLNEDSPPGQGFLSDLCRDWEAEATLAATGSDGAIRVALLRTGLVMAPHGGAFARVLPLVRFGLGGPLGTGRQWWPWITLEDQVSAIVHLLTHDVSGPVDLCSPEPARQYEVVRALGRALKRPTLLPAPAFALRTVLGEFAVEVLGSTRMTPQVLQRTGFAFAHPDLDSAATWLTAPA